MSLYFYARTPRATRGVREGWLLTPEADAASEILSFRTRGLIPDLMHVNGHLFRFGV